MKVRLTLGARPRPHDISWFGTSPRGVPLPHEVSCNHMSFRRLLLEPASACFLALKTLCKGDAFSLPSRDLLLVQLSSLQTIAPPGPPDAFDIPQQRPSSRVLLGDNRARFSEYLTACTLPR
jgi:hypothetical protein